VLDGRANEGGPARVRRSWNEWGGGEKLTTDELVAGVRRRSRGENAEPGDYD
jgi:hypothetical protein